MTNTPWSTTNKVGLALQLLYGLVNIPSVFFPSGTETTAGPPMGVLWADTILGLILAIAAIMAWRNGSRPTARVASASNILISLTGVPAFFVSGVPAWMECLVVVGIVWTIVSVVLTHRPNKKAATV